MLDSKNFGGLIIRQSLFILSTSCLLIFLSHCKASNKNSRTDPSPTKKKDSQKEDNAVDKEDTNQNQGKAEDIANKPTGPSGTCELNSWLSTENDPGGAWWSGPLPLEYKISIQRPVSFSNENTQANSQILVDSDTRFQTIHGFGWSLEESTIFNLRRMSEEKREEFLKKLLDPKLENGIGLNLMRITLGTSDFTAREFYTYNDRPKGQTDLNLDNFSIQKDIEYGIIDVLKQAIQINPDLRLIAAPWSPPAWMKDNDELTGGGNFLTQYIAVYATYLRKAVQAYSELGIPIYAMSMQNEPNLPTEYPSCIMSADQQRQLAVALRKELDENGLNTQLLVWDFNVEIPDDLSFDYISTIYNDTAAFDSVIGAAYHGYWGDPSGMSRLHDSFSNKEIWFTEKSLWGVKGMEELASYLRNWSTSYMGWVTMLDSNIQPEKWSGTPGPSLLIQDANSPDNYWATGEFFMLGQYSRFIKRGSQRIDSSGGIPNTLTHIAFNNPDAQTALVVMNQSPQSQNFSIKSANTDCIASVMVPGKGMGTYTWPSTGCPVCSPEDDDDETNNDDKRRVPFAVHTLPGKIEAEAFDIGTATDPAYLDKDPENRGSEFSTVIRSNEGVDIDQSTDIGGAYHVGWIEEGEWLLYTLDSVTPGSYQLNLRLASLPGGGKIRIYLDDKILGELTVPSTGDWQKFQTVSSSVVIPKNPGKNLRVEFAKGEVNLNWLEFATQ